VIFSLNLTLTWKSLVFIRRTRSFISFMLEGSVKVVLNVGADSTKENPVSQFCSSVTKT
jgi:hypothetical protein